MNKIIIVSAALFISLVSFAQNDSTINRKQAMSTNQKTIEMLNTNGVVMKNNTAMTMNKGKTSPMTRALICYNGTKVSTDGTVSKKDGSQIRLAEGQYMDVSGDIKLINGYKSPSNKNNTKSNQDKNLYVAPDSTQH